MRVRHLAGLAVTVAGLVWASAALAKTIVGTEGSNRLMSRYKGNRRPAKVAGDCEHKRHG
jgi:hypothetical protein